MLTLLIAAGMLAAAQSDPAPGSQVTGSLATDAAPIEVMVLGTYHFTGGGQDLHNADVDDHLAPEDLVRRPVGVEDFCVLSGV